MEHSNFTANKTNKADACNQWATCFQLSEQIKNKYKSRKTLRWFWLGCEHREILINIQIYEHYDCANKMQIEQCWVITQTVLYSKQRNWKQKNTMKITERTWKMAK